MDENLLGLARELRKETCPQRVLDEVARRICAQVSPRSPLRYGIPVAVAGAVLLCGLAVWRWPTGGSVERHPKLVAVATLDRAQIAQQAEGALGFIGGILLDATTHSQTVIFNRAVPPLRNSLEIAKNKIIHRIEP
jgi:hypothetical protein